MLQFKTFFQVDNFCQLLPQDRVQDFSKMDPQQLLRSTLSAVGGQQSVEQLDELIQCRTQQRLLSTRLQNNSQLLEEQVRLNDRWVLDHLNLVVPLQGFLVCANGPSMSDDNYWNYKLWTLLFVREWPTFKSQCSFFTCEHSYFLK